jgi:hypothetical protein
MAQRRMIAVVFAYAQGRMHGALGRAIKREEYCEKLVTEGVDCIGLGCAFSLLLLIELAQPRGSSGVRLRRIHGIFVVIRSRRTGSIET